MKTSSPEFKSKTLGTNRVALTASIWSERVLFSKIPPALGHGAAPCIVVFKKVLDWIFLVETHSLGLLLGNTTCGQRSLAFAGDLLWNKGEGESQGEQLKYRTTTTPTEMKLDFY